MRLHTPLCDLLGIDVPILSVGFGWSAVPELAAAVSNAGGCGVVGLGIPLEHITKTVARTRELTSRSFGRNIIIAALASPHAEEADRAATRSQVEAAIATRVPVLGLFWGDPSLFVAAAHRAGVKLLIQVGSAEEAAEPARAGVDAVILQGLEAGGQVKATRSLWDVLPEAVAACEATPVIASGGIGDGRGIARASAGRAGSVARHALRCERRGVDSSALQAESGRGARRGRRSHERSLLPELA